HKYDPIAQKEFFQVFALFNNTADADRADESPTLPFWTAEQLGQRKQLEGTIADLEKKNKQQGWLGRARLGALKKKLATLKPMTSVPILKELPAGQRRKTRIQFRGNFMDLG